MNPGRVRSFLRVRSVPAVAACAALLAGCSAGATPGTTPGSDDSPSPAVTTPSGPPPTPSPSASIDRTEPTPTDGPDTGAGSTEPDLSAFPDPASLVGQESYDEQGADGVWRTVVGGEPLELVTTFGACFDGGTDDVCAFSITGAAPLEPGTEPGRTDAALLLLNRSTGRTADGTPLWEVLDAVVTVPADGPALLEVCDGEPGVAFYPAGAGDEDELTIPVAQAWGPDETLTSLVELDPASLTCAYVGD